MAPNNVFGEPINNQNQTPYALQAWNEPNAYGKRDLAMKFVQDLKEKYLKEKSGSVVLCVLYNATGRTITFAGKQDWYGEILSSPTGSTYPKTIENGQWGAFLHKNRPGETGGSMAAAVFRIEKDQIGPHCDFMMSWMHPGDGGNKVCTGINDDRDYFNREWNNIKIKLEVGQQDNFTWNGYYATIKTGTEEVSAVVEATFSLQFD